MKLGMMLGVVGLALSMSTSLAGTLYEEAYSTAASCTTGSWTAVGGGFISSKQCDGRAVSGYGSQLAHAQANAVQFGDLGAATGTYCSLWPTQARGIGGGYMADFSCTRGAITGIGSTTTDAGTNALGFAQVSAVGGRRCTIVANDIWAIGGGYIANFSCGVAGLGSTVTAAGANALGFAQLEAAGGRRCSLHSTNVWAVGGGYVAHFSCGPALISGAGSTATDAAANALGFAEVEAASKRRCYLSNTDIRAFPGGYEVRFSCGGKSAVGTGWTLSAAGQAALAKAKLF